MAKRRRTQQIQRRTRASDEALTRPLRSSRGFDPRLLIVGGVLVAGVILIVLALVVFSKPDPSLGTAQPDKGGTHVQDGTDVRGSNPDAYGSLPATSGPHWADPDNWGVYTTPQAESQVVHNLEHGGIVVWYQPDKLDAARRRPAHPVGEPAAAGRAVQGHPLAMVRPRLRPSHRRDGLELPALPGRARHRSDLGIRAGALPAFAGAERRTRPAGALTAGPRLTLRPRHGIISGGRLAQLAEQETLNL